MPQGQALNPKDSFTQCPLMQFSLLPDLIFVPHHWRCSYCSLILYKSLQMVFPSHKVMAQDMPSLCPNPWPPPTNYDNEGDTVLVQQCANFTVFFMHSGTWQPVCAGNCSTAPLKRSGPAAVSCPVPCGRERCCAGKTLQMMQRCVLFIHMIGGGLRVQIKILTMCILYDLILLIQKLLLNRHTRLSLADKPTLSYRIHIYWLFIIFIYGVYYKSRMFFFLFTCTDIYFFFLTQKCATA